MVSISFMHNQSLNHLIHVYHNQSMRKRSGANAASLSHQILLIATSPSLRNDYESLGSPYCEHFQPRRIFWPLDHKRNSLIRLEIANHKDDQSFLVS